MEIVNMNTLNESRRKQAAQMLSDELPMGWPTLAEAIDEVNELLEHDPDFVLLAAMDNGEVLGWCGMQPDYDGKVFELHPLVVRHDRQGKGIGTTLLNAIEEAARERGGLTFWAGADDENGETSFANANLYDDLPKRMREFEPGTHQSAFYLKHGFRIVGVMPDANGKGKPDIFLAKSLSK